METVDLSDVVWASINSCLFLYSYINEQSGFAVFYTMLYFLSLAFHQFVCQVAATSIWNKVYLH